jgi:DNA helicase-2/ATP-dependent DNA helicase PcrA
VEHLEGPLLVLAGPGSGKTRVVTRRIARLVDQGVPPWQILAITFTNKAAQEMAERVGQLLPGVKVWVSTFHRWCARLLRRHAEVVGLQPNFSILDAGDQRTVLRQVLSDLDLDATHFAPNRLLWHISSAKNDLIAAEQYQARQEETVGDYWQAVVARVYPEYQRRLLASNAVDFDDLLLHVATMLSEHELLREELDSRHRFILVDEYQDTNAAQYQIVRALSQRYPHLCATGDPDQSIYGWRGARLANILRFERDFPEARVVRLEDNFRSTRAILRSADALIAHNTQRKQKRLVAQNEEGAPVEVLTYPDSAQEAAGIARRIEQAVGTGQRRYADFAVFYRVNALSRQLEWAMLRRRIPFFVAAGAAFYDRAEIRDLLAYLRLLSNPADRSAFLRVVNTPLRGLGKTSQQRLTAWADQTGVTDLEAARRAHEIAGLSARAVAGFQRFASLIGEGSLADAGSVAGLLAWLIERTGYARNWEQSPVEEDQQRLENVRELVTAARQYDESAGDERSLQGFLEQTVLVSDTDALDDSAGRVTLMTLHAAKGLEFPSVFIVGLEEGLLPHERSLREQELREIEEERRLLFVGMTRAREQLTLSLANRRGLHGRDLMTIPSRFLDEVEGVVQQVDETADDFVSGSSWPEGASQAPSGGSRGADPVPEAERPARRRESDPHRRLMTGADLLGSSAAAIERPGGYRPGMQVRHPRYGRGTVLATGGTGSRSTVTVCFDEGSRTETFVATRCPLQPIGV